MVCQRFFKHLTFRPFLRQLFVWLIVFSHNREPLIEAILIHCAGISLALLLNRVIAAEKAYLRVLADLVELLLRDAVRALRFNNIF